MANQTAEDQFRQEKQEIIKQIMSSDLHGKRIYLLGSAEFGPTNEPIYIKSTAGLYTKFGTEGSLINAFHALKYTDKDNKIYLVKTTGEHATAHLNINIYNGEIIENGFIISSSESNEIFNEIEIRITAEGLEFWFPKDLLSEPLYYNYNDYPTIEELTNAINADTKLKKSYLFAYHSVEPATPTKHAFFSCNPGVTYMYGGQCGLHYSKNLLYNCLSRTYDMLESSDIDIIIPVDAFVDDIYPADKDNELHRYNMTYYQSTKDYLTEDYIEGKQLSYLNQLLNFCLRQLNFGIVTTGIMGFNSYHERQSNYLGEEDELAEMYTACLEYNLSCCDNPFYAFLVSVVAGDIEYNHGAIIDNGYLAYAALCAKTIITSGTTNIPISNTIGIYHEFTEPVLQKLAKSGIVVFRQSPLYDTPVVYDGITLSPEYENLKLYCNVRMIQMCISYINKLFQFYIGHDMIKLIRQNIIVSDLNNILKTLKDRSIITSYNFTLVPYYARNEIKVYLTLHTVFTVKAVTLCAVIEVASEEEY